MATHIPQNLYSAGAVTLNSQPSVNFYAQLVQKKQAREEALDQYEMNRINRMNEQGVRDKDREGLDQRVLDMKAYYQANKDKIRRGGTPEAYNYEKMFRDTLAGVSESKNATALGQSTYKLIQERRKLGRNTPDDMFTEYQQMEDTPVWDKNYKRFDLMKWNAQTGAKYDPKKTLDTFKDIKRTPLSPRYEPIQGDKFSRMEFIDEAFDPNAKMAIAARASDLYDHDDGFFDAVKSDFDNPIKRGELEKLFVKEYGTAPQSMSDYAAAKALEQLQTTTTGKPKKVELWQEKQDYLQKYKQANIRLARFLGNFYKDEDSKQPFDLTNYTVTDDGQYDITQPLKGVAMNRTKTGESRFSNKVLFNPQTQEFTYFDPVTKEAVRKPFTQFVQDVKTNNPGMDIKFIETMQNPIGTRVPKNQQAGSGQQGKTMSSAEFRKLSITQRQQFINSGGKVQ